MAKIEHATDEQWAEVEKCRVRWLTEEQTKQYPVTEIRETVYAALDRIKHPHVPVLVVDSPTTARTLDVLLFSNASKFDIESGEVDIDEVFDTERVQEMCASVNVSAGDMKAALADEVPLKFYCGLWWNAWMGYYEGASILGVPTIPEYEPFLAWNRKCPVWMWSNKCIYILRRPHQIHWSDSPTGGLHNTSGPAVEWSPDFKLWMIEGNKVDEQIVMRPETQTLAQIESESNADIKAIRIERFGWDRYLRESKATCIDRRHNTVENTLEALFQVPGGGRRLLATCPTGRLFCMGVADDINSCEEAAAWFNPNGERCLGRT